MRFFACVVGAICKSPLCCCVRFCLESPTLQFTHVGGLIAISPYTGVFWTFANIHVNTQKTSQAWCEYVCARCRGELEFALVANRPYREPCFQVLKIVKINTINKIKPINNEKIFIFAL